MKITSFNPLIVTKDAENTIKLFEELGFKKRHTKDNISMNSVTDYRMKNDDGFYVDITQSDDQERTFIRINVSDFDEAVEFFKAHGFRMARHEAAKDTVDTGSSKFNIMVSPSGFIIALSYHKKDTDNN
jgi:predicted lactoylglutathione lyase